MVKKRFLATLKHEIQITRDMGEKNGRFTWALMKP